MPGFDAVLFDLDETLCRHDQDTDAMYAGAFDRVGEDPFGDPAAFWASLQGPPDHDDWIGYLGAGFARLAAQHDRTEVDPIALAEALAALVDDSAVALLPGAMEALDSAAAVGPIGLVTNGPETRQRTKLQALGIDDRFAVTVYAGDLLRSKPHAAPFEQALAELDCPPDRVLYVGNSLAYDVAGGQNAGLPVAWLRGDSEDAGAYSPEYVLDSLADLPAILGSDR